MLGKRNAATIVYRDFLPNTGERYMSVDRLDFASSSEMTKIVRSYGHPFQGWLIKTSDDIRHLNCEVKTDPNPRKSIPRSDHSADRNRRRQRSSKTQSS